MIVPLRGQDVAGADPTRTPLSQQPRYHSRGARLAFHPGTPIRPLCNRYRNDLPAGQRRVVTGVNGR